MTCFFKKNMKYSGKRDKIPLCGFDKGVESGCNFSIMAPEIVEWLID
jgi:hypothetical protein